MQTTYFILFTLLGGLIAIFVLAGWTSYSEGKLPEKMSMFQWFLAGITASGLSSYMWLFGAGGDPSKVLDLVSKTLEVKDLLPTLGGGGGSVVASEPKEEKPAVKAEPTEITVGMPNF
jgi:hypothetical protein